MDIAACARRIFVLMEHTTRDGRPRLRRRCALPLTAPGVVKLVVTDLGVFEHLDAPVISTFKAKCSFMLSKGCELRIIRCAETCCTIQLNCKIFT